MANTGKHMHHVSELYISFLNIVTKTNMVNIVEALQAIITNTPKHNDNIEWWIFTTLHVLKIN